jgi:hypothetical protein
MQPDMSMSVSQGPRGDAIDIAYGDSEACVWKTNDWKVEITKCLGEIPRIDSVRSRDGGATWSAPTAAAKYPRYYDWSTRKFYWNLPESPKVTRGVGNDVFVAWQTWFWPGWSRTGAFPIESQIKVRRSTDGGASFGPAATAADVTIASGLQGNFPLYTLAALAVDTSGGPNSGTAYLSWHDGRNRSVRSFGATGWNNGLYRFSDVFLARSTDAGTTWSAPVKVNDDPITLNVDHFFPSLTVDRTGKLYALFYDRRNDPRNFLIDTYLATSEDGGRTFENKRLTRQSMPPLTAVPVDTLVNPYWHYFAHKVGVAADSTGHGEGVLAAWGDTSLGNLNVAVTGTDRDNDRVATLIGKER